MTVGAGVGIGVDVGPGVNVAILVFDDWHGIELQV